MSRTASMVELIGEFANEVTFAELFCNCLATVGRCCRVFAAAVHGVI